MSILCRLLQCKYVYSSVNSLVCQGPPPILFSQMLTTRTAEKNVGGNHFQIITNRGCPQGGVLSPLRWSLVVDELLGILTGNGVTCLGYADDIVIMAKGKFVGTLCDLAERELETTRRWCISGIENQLIKNLSGTFYQENNTSALEKYPLQRRKLRMAARFEVSRTYPRLKTYLAT